MMCFKSLSQRAGRRTGGCSLSHISSVQSILVCFVNGRLKQERSGKGSIYPRGAQLTENLST